MHTNTLTRAIGNDDYVMPSSVPAYKPARFDAVRNDFIQHPAQFPIRYRRRDVLPWRNRRMDSAAGDLGLSFHSAKYIPAGTRIELEIPLRGDSQRFAGTVVMVREEAEGYEIGLWLASPDDATRARIVERICHTECYLRSRQSGAS
jgi:hypothetical protein